MYGLNLGYLRPNLRRREDHLEEALPSRHHRVDVLLLFAERVQHAGPVTRQKICDSFFKIVLVRELDARSPHGVRQSGVARVVHLRGRVSVVMEAERWSSDLGVSKNKRKTKTKDTRNGRQTYLCS